MKAATAPSGRPWSGWHWQSPPRSSGKARTYCWVWTSEAGFFFAAPSPPGSRSIITVGLLVAAKLALHDAMLAAEVNNIELAGRLGLDEKAVRRLRDPLHRSHIGAVEAALRALGRRLLVEVVAVA